MEIRTELLHNTIQCMFDYLPEELIRIIMAQLTYYQISNFIITYEFINKINKSEENYRLLCSVLCGCTHNEYVCEKQHAYIYKRLFKLSQIKYYSNFWEQSYKNLKTLMDKYPNRSLSKIIINLKGNSIKDVPTILYEICISRNLDFYRKLVKYNPPHDLIRIVFRLQYTTDDTLYSGHQKEFIDYIVSNPKYISIIKFIRMCNYRCININLKDLLITNYDSKDYEIKTKMLKMYLIEYFPGQISNLINCIKAYIELDNKIMLEWLLGMIIRKGYNIKYLILRIKIEMETLIDQFYQKLLDKYISIAGYNRDAIKKMRIPGSYYR